MRVKRILPVIVFIIFLLCPLEAHAEIFTVDGMEFDTDVVFTDDFNILCAPGDSGTSPGGIIKSIEEKEAGYWKSGSGNYYLVVNTLYGGQGMSFNILMENIPHLRPYLVYTGGKVGLCVGDSEHPKLVLDSAVGEGFSWYKILCYGVGFADGKYTYGNNYELYNRYEDFHVQIYTNSLNVNSNTVAEAYKICTNIPFFLTQDAADLYLSTGKTDGAANAEQIKNMTDPEVKNTYDNNVLWLKMGNYDGGMLTIRPVRNAYCEWAFTPQATEGYTDLTLDVSFEVVTSFHISKLSHSLSMSGASSLPLAECVTSYGTRGIKVYPCGDLQDSLFDRLAGDLLSYLSSGMTDEVLLSQVSLSVNESITFGDKFGISIGNNDQVKSTGSIMTVKMKLKGKKNGDWVNGPAVVERVNLYTGDCNELVAHADEEGNYKEDDSSIKTTDKNGNVTITNNVSGGGGSGGGSSSASGGSATATVGNVTNTNTFKFPDKLDINLNVKDIDIDLDVTQKKGFLENLLNAGNLVLGFIKTLVGTGNKVLGFADEVLDTVGGDVVSTAGNVMSGIAAIASLSANIVSGFGLFSGQSGLIGLFSDTLGAFPTEFWVLVYASISVGIILMIFQNR